MTRVSSDALPALTGRRRVGAVQSGRFSGKQGGTAENCFFCPCSLRGTRAFLFLSERRNTYVRSRQTMATPGKTRKPIQQSFDYQKGVFYYEKGYFSGSVRYDDAYHVRRMQGIRNCRNCRHHGCPHFRGHRRNRRRHHPRRSGIQRCHCPAAGSRFSG